MRGLQMKLRQVGSRVSASSMALSVMAAALLFGFFGRVIYYYSATESLPLARAIACFAGGTLFDLAVGFYLLAPFLPFFLLREPAWERLRLQLFLAGIFSLEVLLLTISVCSEALFIEEFRSRFNFIAVDYLVYTNEVLKNIWESYPLGILLPAAFGLSAVVSFFMIEASAGFMRSSTRKVRLCLGIAAITGVLVAALVPSEARLLERVESTEGELVKNGIHALFAAYLGNEIDYQAFYPSNGEKESAHLVHEHMELDYGVGGLIDQLNLEEENSIARNIEATGPERRLNVVLVLMESMSARFMRAYGAEKELTPNLDQLARNGLFYDRLYATGTRTVRGLEALVLSMPPTPGQSVVRRPGSEELFSIGTVLREKGYKTEFLYGGRAYFDNMRNFFESNKFEVVDQTDIPGSERVFSNAWGVSDEDLFRMALRQQNKISAQGGRPFFQLILTTSNHRPFTFPDGRIDLPSPSGRDGAVKYADHAIGEFIRSSEKLPWFKDTIYVFVADHNASVAGGTKVLPADYRIPAIFYSPGNIKARKSSILSSQIDIAPTILGLLNFSYQSRFFGHDLANARTERAFLGTYQRVGLWENNRLVLLSPNFRLEAAELSGEIPIAFRNFDGSLIPENEPALKMAVAYYETASYWFKSKLLKESKVYSTVTNVRTY